MDVILADWKVLPKGTRIELSCFPDHVFTVLDTGSAIRGRRIDVWMPSHEMARQFGRHRSPRTDPPAASRRAASSPPGPQECQLDAHPPEAYLGSFRDFCHIPAKRTASKRPRRQRMPNPGGRLALCVGTLWGDRDSTGRTTPHVDFGRFGVAPRQQSLSVLNAMGYDAVPNPRAHLALPGVNMERKFRRIPPGKTLGCDAISA